ncbi:MAG TPA: ParB/RepB/Spo0J family partition protein [Candidatus Dormibacteraeota bacterium]|jgi:ParB family chromosome partitioning protein|nr:ParB/RepB/Spo0J family partition protein [Candidatus Dormibacteraeota bacterium]
MSPDLPTPPPSKRRGLGRGLDALLSSSAVLGPAPAAGTPAANADTGLVDVDPQRVEPNPEQPRRSFDEEALAALADSIRTHGLLHPIVVERVDADRYRLVAGERRLRAAKQAGVSSIPAIVRPAAESARQALELALVENLQRAQLSPLEEAAAYARLADTFGLSHEAIGLRVGRSRSAVSNMVRLLALAAEAQEALADGRITAGHARALLALPEDAQAELARRVAEEGLSVRRVEQLVLEHTAAATPAPPQSGAAARAGAVPTPLTPDDSALQRGFEEALGTPVHLQRRRRGGGRLLIDFYSDEELDALYTKLGGPQL